MQFLLVTLRDELFARVFPEDGPYPRLQVRPLRLQLVGRERTAELTQQLQDNLGNALLVRTYFLQRLHHNLGRHLADNRRQIGCGDHPGRPGGAKKLLTHGRVQLTDETGKSLVGKLPGLWGRRFSLDQRIQQQGSKSPRRKETVLPGQVECLGNELRVERPLGERPAARHPVLEGKGEALPQVPGAPRLP